MCVAPPSASAQDSPYAQAVEADHPVAYYQLADAAGSTQAVDSMGGAAMVAHNGVTFGAPGPSAVGTSAASFNGSNQFLSVTPPVLSQTSNWTLEAWAAPAAGSQQAMFTYDGNDTTGFGFGEFSPNLDGSPGTCLQGLFGLISWLAPSPQQCFSPGVWHYLVLEADASGNTSFYVDGQPVAVGAWSGSRHTPNAPQGASTIGGMVDGSNNPGALLSGSVAQVAYYNYALPTSRIHSHFLAGQLPPTNTSVPTVSGVLQQGQTVHVVAGSWSGTQPISYSYQWERCDSGGSSCAPISGATDVSYTLTSGDVGSTIEVSVSASNAAGTASATSAPSDAVLPPLPVKWTAPVIDGIPRDGATLTTSTGTWLGTRPMTFAYQWQRCDTAGANCSPIAGATGSTYVLGSSDVGRTIEVTVTASNAVGSGTASSPPTDVIASRPAAVTLTYGYDSNGRLTSVTGP